MFSLFNNSNSVDGILANFKNTIDNLKRVSNYSKEEAEVVEDKILDMQEYQANLLAESVRADIVAEKLSEIFNV